MAKLVTIFGGSGFVGRYIAHRLASDGWRVRVAVRDPEKAGFVRTYGVVGQVEPVACNIRDDESVARALSGADAAVNAVGLLAEVGRNKFDAVHTEGAERVARTCAALGITNLVQISAIGAAQDSRSLYARTKFEGEEAIKRHVPGAVILRPSIIFGPEDGFFNRFASNARFNPVVPLVGGNTLFQPVFVDDVALAAQIALSGGVPGGTYELGGPDVESFRTLMHRMLRVIRRRRLVVNLPFWLGGMSAKAFGLTERVTLGLLKGPITTDQVHNLRRHNVVDPKAQGFEAFGIVPTSMELVLPEYLWRFRPDGQFYEITESAQYLRT